MNSIGANIKVVLFDHDDTLVGTIQAKFAEHKYIARKYYGKDLTDEDIKAHWGKPLSTLLQLLYGTDNIDQAMAFNKTAHKDYPKLLLDDTKVVLRQLKQAKKLIGVITATSRYSLTYDYKSMHIPLNLFDYIQTEEDTPYHKPDFRVFDPAINWLESIQITPNEVLYVGDGLHDMEAALGAGFEFIAVATGLVTQESFKSAGANSIKRLGDLIK